MVNRLSKLAPLCHQRLFESHETRLRLNKPVAIDVTVKLQMHADAAADAARTHHQHHHHHALMTSTARLLHTYSKQAHGHQPKGAIKRSKSIPLAIESSDFASFRCPCPLCAAPASSISLFSIQLASSRPSPASIPPFKLGQSSNSKDELHGRAILSCAHCSLLFVPPTHHLTPSDERARYDLHCNDAHDEGYKSFMRRLTRPLAAQVLKRQSLRSMMASPTHAIGLDFGCGPTPLLASIMKNDHDIEMQSYDPLYFPNQELLSRVYPFVSCSEVVEHFATPHASWSLLQRLVAPDGILAVSTSVVPERYYMGSTEMKKTLRGNAETVVGAADPHLCHPSSPSFAHWSYARDPTHICFYSRSTFDWIEQHWGWRRIQLDDNVWIGRKMT